MTLTISMEILLASGRQSRLGAVVTLRKQLPSVMEAMMYMKCYESVLMLLVQVSRLDGH